MTCKPDHLKKYIRLAVRAGAAIQPGQKLVLRSPVECADIARMAADEAYAAGAKEVIVDWTDDGISRGRFLYAADDVFDEFPAWTQLLRNSLSAEGAAFLAISAEDPEAFKGADLTRITRSESARRRALRPYYDRVMTNGIQWCVISVPTEAWARKVFGGAAKTAVNKLWDTIFAAARIADNDPVENWLAHTGRLKGVVSKLNKFGFISLKFENSLGTDLIVGLPKGHVWQGGGDVCKNGRAFFPNIPTEEAFTAPDSAAVNGTAVSTKPLVYGGNVIDGFSLTFNKGRVVSFTADKNRALLEQMLGSCKNMDRLGEVALVPVDSPISAMDTLFYNTLYDENASSHLALGQAYADCVRGGSDKSRAQLRRLGLNNSDSHVDFMIGSADMKVTGFTQDWKEIAVMKDGKFTDSFLN
ncbi:MAG: aminopeptidase [Defluviitaleaceae bacterium]|nr:aminopeptidase [Defluviitaleaceae bacterium]